MTDPTHSVLLDRYLHVQHARKKPFKHWAGCLSWWANWLRKLLASPQPTRCPDHLRPVIEAELAWAVADLNYLKTLTYFPPKHPAPSAARRKLNDEVHPFIHLLVRRQHTKPRKTE